MKHIASLVIATLTTLIAIPSTQAHDGPGKNNNKKKSIGFVPDSHCKPHYCAPTLLFTKEIDRCYHTKSGYDSHGCFFHYKVLVITYASYFSNGSSRTYTRTYRV